MRRHILPACGGGLRANAHLLLPSVAVSGGGVGGTAGETGRLQTEGGGFERLVRIVCRPLEGGRSGFIAISILNGKFIFFLTGYGIYVRYVRYVFIHSFHSIF